MFCCYVNCQSLSLVLSRHLPFSPVIIRLLTRFPPRSRPGKLARAWKALFAGGGAPPVLSNGAGRTPLSEQKNIRAKRNAEIYAPAPLVLLYLHRTKKHFGMKNLNQEFKARLESLSCPAHGQHPVISVPPHGRAFCYTPFCCREFQGLVLSLAPAIYQELESSGLYLP